MEKKAKINVLFVDDDHNVLDGLQRGLRTMREQWDMTFVSDPNEAVDILQKTQFDVIITDMQMPGMSGVELLAHAKYANEEIFRIILSGEMSSELGPLAKELAHVCIRKPCSPKQLIAEIERLYR